MERGMLQQFRRVLSKPNFAKLWTGQSVSWFGDSLYFLSLLWLVQEMTGSKAMMGLVAVARTVPQLLGFVAGALVDRLNKRNSMVAVSVCQALLVSCIPLFKVFGVLRVWHIPFVAFGLALLGTFFFPARQALLPDLVEQHELVTANALMSVSQQTVSLLGYSTGGLFIASFGVMPLFALDAATFVVAAIAIWLLDIRKSGTEVLEANPAGRTHVFGDVVQGIRFIGTTRALIIAIPLSIAINFLFAPLSVLMPAWVTEVLNREADAYGFIQSAMMVGMVVGSFVAGLLAQHLSKSGLILGGIVMTGLSLVAFAISRNIWLVLACMAAFGLSNAVTNVLFTAYIQSIVPRDMIGRVFGAVGTIGQVAVPVGQALAGLLGETYPLPLVFGCQGAVTALLAGIYLLWPGIRQVFDQAEVPIPTASAEIS